MIELPTNEPPSNRAIPGWLLDFAAKHRGDWQAYEKAKRVIWREACCEQEYKEWIKRYTRAANL